MNNDLILGLGKNFSKSELLSISEELGLTIPLETNARVIITKIVDDIANNGLPEFDTVSDTLAEFLVAAEYYTADGQEIKHNGKEQRPTEQLKPEVVEEKLPECYGFEDDKDPACTHCAVQKQCRETRIANRPECFGKCYAATAPECQACLEAYFCQNNQTK